MKILFSLLFATCTLSAMGQNYIDLLKVRYQATPQNSFDTGSSQTHISEFGLALTLPLKLSEKTAIITGGAIDKFGVNLVPNGERTSLSSYLLKFGVNINHSDKISGTYLLLPKLASNFVGDLNRADFQLGALGLLKFKKKRKL